MGRVNRVTLGSTTAARGPRLILRAVEQTAAQAALLRRARRRAPSPTASETTQAMQTAGGSWPRRWVLRFEFRFRRSTQSLATTM
jgi:hypothetical protein